MNNEEMLNSFKLMLKQSIQELADELKGKIEDSTKEIKQQISQVTADTEEMKEEILELKEENTLLTQRVMKLEQYSRKPNVIINGIPMVEEETGEQLRSAVIDIAKKMQVTLEPYDICALHRLNPPRNKDFPPAVIIKLNSHIKKRMMIRKSKEVRLENIYVNNHLTNEMREIKAVALKLRREGKLKHVWDTDNGDVLVRITDDMKPYMPRSTYELEEFVKSALEKRPAEKEQRTREKNLKKATPVSTRSRSTLKTLDNFVTSGGNHSQFSKNKKT